MQPSLSIIVFTTSSGAGYGLLFWLGLGAASGLLPADRGFGAVALGLAIAAVTAGLLASTLHLGRPARAWRAFSQWRSSWLSREGVASVVTYAPALLLAWGWVVRGSLGGVWSLCAVLTAILAAVTVVCTAYIYRSLKPIAQWCNGWVPANYLALAAMTGALWLAALAALFNVAAPVLSWLALLTILIAAALKFLYWRHIDRTPGLSTAESATGLGALGTVRLFEAPHTSENYLLKEMGFAIARKHASKLRWIAAMLGFALPLLLTLFTLVIDGGPRGAVALLAAVAAVAGVLVERWLFFAEAKHTVTLYYGAARA